MFSYDNLEFRYVPYPIGVAGSVFEPGLYRDLVAAYPPRELFARLEKVGNKNTLSEKFNSRQYRQWIASQPLWREFHDWIKSRAFIREVLETLREHDIDLGFDTETPEWKRRWKRFRDFATARSGARSVRLRSRFEFSMLPARGGHVLPHSDNAAKIVTLVISMIEPGTWNPAWGGGTDVNRPKDERLTFNRINRQLPFDQVECLHTFEFAPNQAIVFVKTFNSWHSVRPMTGEESAPMRRTLTVNIEAPG